ncbi:MAG TPA: hypothetical protein VFY84_19175 [Jiangellales bacterium]|nr:hypothetical protein [Jiangellales bacterium]
MTEQPWTPAPNPGSAGRALIRHIVADWLTAGAIPRVLNVYPGQPMEELWEAFPAGTQFGALVGVHVSAAGESRSAYTGPTDPGGKMKHWEVRLDVHHRAYDIEPGPWDAGEDDYDRVFAALEDRLRAEGRCLGRPDVILQAGEWPREDSIRDEYDEPWWNGGVRDQWGRIFFVVSQYMQRQP